MYVRIILRFSILMLKLWYVVPVMAAVHCIIVRGDVIQRNLFIGVRTATELMFELPSLLHTMVRLLCVLIACTALAPLGSG